MMVSQIGRALIVSLQSCPGNSTMLVGSCTLFCVAVASHLIVPYSAKAATELATHGFGRKHPGALHKLMPESA
jgi:hypothetical protein